MRLGVNKQIKSADVMRKPVDNISSNTETLSEQLEQYLDEKIGDPVSEHNCSDSDDAFLSDEVDEKRSYTPSYHGPVG